MITYNLELVSEYIDLLKGKFHKLNGLEVKIACKSWLSNATPTLKGIFISTDDEEFWGIEDKYGGYQSSDDISKVCFTSLPGLKEFYPSAFRMSFHDFREIDTQKEEFNALRYCLEIPTQFIPVNYDLPIGKFERELYEHLTRILN